MQVLANELEKLCAYAKANGKSAVTVADVNEICSTTVECDAFAISNAIIEKNMEKAFLALTDMRQQRVEPPVVLAQLSKTYSETYNLLTTYKSAYVGDHETHAEKIKEYEQKLADASAAKRAYEESTYNPALQSKLEAEKEMAESSVELKEARERSEELVEKVLRPLRENEDVQRKISLIQNGVSFEYEKIVSKTNSTTTENDNYSFLTVSIAISDDEEFVAEIAEKVKQNTPLFVEKTIERLTGLAEANCVIISPYSNVSNLDANGFVVTTARVSAVAGFLALAGTCFIVILSHMTKAYLASTPKDEDESLPENAQK
jgi:DNA polymerase III gamma/tau subunit